MGFYACLNIELGNVGLDAHANDQDKQVGQSRSGSPRRRTLSGWQA